MHTAGFFRECSMIARKPANWRYIKDIRGGDWRLMKGDFGECIVREFLEERGILLERLQRRAPGLPDFKIRGLPVLIEVKAHRDRGTGNSVSKPHVWQRHTFIPLRRLGYAIYVARPDIDITIDGSTVICSRIDWYAFSGSGVLEPIASSQHFLDSFQLAPTAMD